MIRTLLLFAVAASPPPAEDGEIAAIAGPLILQREGKAYRATPPVPLRPGDRLGTSGGGGASLLLPGGGILDLGSDTTVTLGGRDGRTIEMSRGEARAVVADAPLTLTAAGGRIAVARGILHAATTSQGAKAWVEAGSAEVSGGGRSVALAEGQETSLPNSGDPAAPTPAKPEGWALQASSLRMATAADASRRAKQRLAGDANDAVAKTFRPSGQAPEAGQENPEGPTTPNPNPAAPTDEMQTAPNPNANTEATNPTPADEADTIGANSSVTQPAATSAIALALGSSSAAVGAGSSGGDFSDAQQDSLTTKTVSVPGNPMLPLAGNIHIIAAQSRYTLGDVRLSANDRFPVQREYWSIGLGASPTRQVVTTFKTASDPIPQTLRIPRTDAYLVRFPQSNFGIPDPATGGGSTNASGISGLVGAVPVAPQVAGATPLLDPNAIFNDRATFALGDFALQRSAKDKPQIDIRRGDQDRQIIKSPDGNDQKDKVTLNPQVRFVAVRDAKFFPELPAVSRPGPNDPVGDKPTYANISQLRKAGATTLLADKLSDFSLRTGRTRFVLGGKVVDITGYRPPGGNAMRNVMRPPTVGALGGGGPGGRGPRVGHSH